MLGFRLWRGNTADDPCEVIGIMYLGDGVVYTDYYNFRTKDKWSAPKYTEGELAGRKYVVTTTADYIDEGWTLVV